MTIRLSRRPRRLVRSAGLVAVAAAAAFSLTACQGDGKDAAGPEKKDTASASHSTSDGALGGSRTGADKDRTGMEKASTDVNTATSAAHRTTTSSAPARAAAPVRTQRLADGSTAKVYKLGSQHYRADLVSRGEVFATLETGESDDGLDANDMFVTLTLDGQVHSWMGGGHQGPGTFKLAGGWTAKVTKLGDSKFRAQIIGHDGVAATMDANRRDVGLDANGVYIVLSFGGLISAHM